MTNTSIIILEITNYRIEIFVMSKIISLIITFLNRINKIIRSFIISLDKFIKVDDPAIIEPFVKLEHKDYKLLIKENNIKPVTHNYSKDITTNIKCPHSRHTLSKRAAEKTLKFMFVRIYTILII